MSKKRTANFFDSYAIDFNTIYGNENTMLNRFINTFFRKSMRLRFIKTINGCQPIEGKSVIDIGCGPGYYGITLAKRGASRVLGIDFAKNMVDIASSNAKKASVAEKCEFILCDFMFYPINDKFDYSIVMGFMDYVDEPKKVIEKVLSITKSRAFFSFPIDIGILAWQRKSRYKKKCNLYMYNKENLLDLFEDVRCKKFEYEKISRDYFVSISL